LVNGAELPKTYVDPISGVWLRQGMIVAFQRAIIKGDMEDPVADRIRVIFNELLTMQHPPLSAHPNIVNLLGIDFENEGLHGSQIAMPVLIPECAELGNLAEVLRTARREDRLLNYEETMSLCLDVAHGLEVLHACGEYILYYRYWAFFVFWLFISVQHSLSQAARPASNY
jgi:serine/threonine protein kinase